MFVTDTARRRKGELEALPLKRAIDDSMLRATQGEEDFVPVLLDGSYPGDSGTARCNL